MKRILILIFAAVIVLMLLPFIAVKIINGDEGFACILILFYCINPLFILIISIYSGLHIRQLWFVPIICSVIFSVTAFYTAAVILLYSAVYLALGIIFMFVSAFIKKLIKK